MEKKLYQNLRDIRKRKGMSLKDVSDATGIDSGYLSKLERGIVENIGFEKMLELLNLLEISVQDFLAGNTESNQNISYNNFMNQKNYPYIKLGIEAKKEGLSPEDAQEIIKLYRKISVAIEKKSVEDEYHQISLKAKEHNIDTKEFRKMIDFLISQKNLK